MNFAYAVLWSVVTATAAAYALRVPVEGRWGRAVTAGGIGFFLVASMAAALSPFVPIDFQSFWGLGRVLVAGGDATAFVAGHPLPPLNPPSAYPLFAAAGALPLRAAIVAWTAVAAAASVALVPVSRRTLADRGVPGAADLNGWGLALLTSAFVISNAPRSMIQCGQVSFATALGLIAALACQSRGRPGWAGFWLVPGTIKPNTALPFFLLFLRRRDAKTWAVAGVLGVTVLLASGWARDPLRHVTTFARTIEKHGKPGGVNDYTFTGTLSAGMVNLDYAFYRVGLHAPGSAGRAQLVAVALMGAGLAVRVFRRRGDLATGGDCALVALYSMVFLYHRVHDCVVLALPLTYAVARARAATGKARWAFAASAGAVLLALAQQRKAVELLEGVVKGRGDAAGRLVQALVLPYATWLILGAMLAIVLGDRWAPEPIAAGMDRDRVGPGRERKAPVVVG